MQKKIYINLKLQRNKVLMINNFNILLKYLILINKEYREKKDKIKKIYYLIFYIMINISTKKINILVETINNKKILLLCNINNIFEFNISNKFVQKKLFNLLYTSFLTKLKKLEYLNFIINNKINLNFIINKQKKLTYYNVFLHKHFFCLFKFKLNDIINKNLILNI
jgi:hypothetical protein